MPTLVGLRAYGRTWTRFGPFHLGAPVYKSLAVVSVLGALILVWIGVQPPNEKALTVVLATAAVLLAAWWLGVRRRFPGPPVAPLSTDAGRERS